MSVKKRKKKNIRFILILAAILVVLGTIVAVQTVEREHNVSETAAPSDMIEPGTGEVVLDGKKYQYNDHLSNFLFLGIDNRQKEATKSGQANAGQADALYLLSWDRVKDEITVIAIPRDTLTQIEVFGLDGESLGQTEDHISLSYAYGDGVHESCRMTEEAVSALFYGLPIQGYCSINMDGIPVLVEGVGNLTVTVPNDSLEAVDPQYQVGAEVVLDSENAETFVRYRDVTVSQSAISRMERQEVFLRAYGTAAEQKFTSDPEFITEMYSALEPYMVTNMGSDQFAKIMESAAEKESVRNWTVPGKGEQGKTYDEYHVDENALYEKIIETFYEEVR